eukprot:6175509-Pleurochrysis_carterae.AAC.1
MLAFAAIYADGEICGYPPRPDRMHPIGSYVLRRAGCHECEDHNLYGLRAMLECSSGSASMHEQARHAWFQAGRVPLVIASYAKARRAQGFAPGTRGGSGRSTDPFLPPTFKGP